MTPEQSPLEPIRATFNATGMVDDDPRNVYEIGITFTYDAREPYCLSLSVWIIGESDTASDWTVARETVHVACVWGTDTAPAGADFSATSTRAGHVRLRFHHSDRCGNSYLDVQVELAGLYAFLERTVAAVPPGTEARHLNIDAGLAQLLAH